MKGFLKSSYDWGIYEIKNQEVISSYVIPGRPYCVTKEPTRYWVFAQYREINNIPNQLAYIKVNILLGHNKVTKEDKIIVERFIRTQLLKDLDIPVAFF